MRLNEDLGGRDVGVKAAASRRTPKGVDYLREPALAASLLRRDARFAEGAAVTAVRIDEMERDTDGEGDLHEAAAELGDDG